MPSDSQSNVEFGTQLGTHLGTPFRVKFAALHRLRINPLTVLAIVIVAVLLTGLLLAVPAIGADGGRRLLVLHVALAGVLLPLTMAAGFAWPAATLVALPIAALLTGITWLAPGKPLLTTFLPTLSEPAFALLLIGAALLVGVVLVRLSLPKRNPARAATPAAETGGLAWSALPLAVVLISLAWAWTAADAQAGHIRAELATWAAGHAVPFFLASLLVCAWTGLAEIDGARRTRWCAAAALPALAVLVMQAVVSVDDERYLRTFPELLRWALWPVPLLVAIAILRDDIRRSVAGWPLAVSATLFALWPVAGYALTVEDSALTRLALIGIAHTLPLALLIAGGALLIRRQARLAKTPSPAQSFAPPVRRVVAQSFGAVFAIAVLAVLFTRLGTPPPKPALPERLPQGDTPRQHVDNKRSEEIAQRFAQGVEMMRLKQYEFASKAFHRVLELDPTLPEAHVNMGFALLETGDPAGAQRFFESATRLKRDQLNAYYGLALAANAQKNFEVAVGAMRTWIHLAPPNDPFRKQAEVKFDEMQAAFMAQRRAAATPPARGS